MTERGARQALLASVATIVLIVAGALAASGVQPVEVVATALVVPIFAAGLLGGHALGFTAALVAVVAYAVLRQLDVDDAGLAGIVALVGARAATYAVVAHVGHLSERVVGMLADDGAAGPPSGRSAAGGRPPGRRPSTVGVAAGPPPDVPGLGELAGAPEASWSPGPAGSPGPTRPPEPSWPPEPAGYATPGDPERGAWSPEVEEPAEPGGSGDAAWEWEPEEPAAAESSWSPEPPWSPEPAAASASWSPEPPWPPEPAGYATPGDPERGAWSPEVEEPAEPGGSGDAAWEWEPEEPAAAESSWSPEPPWSRQPAAAWDQAAQVAGADPRADERDQGWPDNGVGEREPYVGEGYEQVGWDETVLPEQPLPPAPVPPAGPQVERPSPPPVRSPAAAIDPETRLCSARYLCDRLAAEQARASYDRAPYSLVMVQVPGAPLAALPHRRQVTLLRELGHQFVAGGLVDHLVHVPDGSQHWFAVVLPEVDRAGAQAVEQRLRTGIRGYLRSRGLRLDDVQSASLTAPGDDPAMDAIWESLIGHGDPDAQPAMAHDE